jgi:hypothetical protein
MVRSDTAIPSLRNSPWIRGAPHREFAAAALFTSARTASSVLGRPGRARAERPGGPDEDFSHSGVPALGAA